MIPPPGSADPVDASASARQSELTADAQQTVTLTVDQAHQLSGTGNISRGGFYSAVRRGQVPHVRLGHKILIPRKALLAWLESAGDRSQIGGAAGGDEPPGAAAWPRKIKAVPDRFDPWAGPAWDFILRKREAWQASGKSAPFTASVDEILRALGAPVGTAKTRRDVNRVCRIMRGRGLLYIRQRIFADDGSPVYRGATAERVREYHFRWPQAADNTEGVCPP